MIPVLITMGMLMLLGCIIWAGCWSAMHTISTDGINVSRKPDLARSQAIERAKTAQLYANQAKPSVVLGCSLTDCDHHDAPCWCMYCDDIVETRYMRWDFARYGCLKCIEGVAVPTVDNLYANSQVKAVSAGIATPNEARDPVMKQLAEVEKLYQEVKDYQRKLEAKDAMLKKLHDQAVRDGAECRQLMGVRRDGMYEVRVWQERNPIARHGISDGVEVRKFLP